MGRERDEEQCADGGVVESIFFVLFTLVDLTYILIAVTYIDSCPKGQMIPIYNIVSGFLNISTSFIDCYGTPCSKSFLKCWNFVSKALEGAWLAAGFYWTFQIFPPDYINEASAEYCHQVFYSFSLVTVTISSIIYVTILYFEMRNKCKGNKETSGLAKELEAAPEVVAMLTEVPRSPVPPTVPSRTLRRKRKPPPLEIRHKHY
ncbi:uncharacterized protein LOC127586634 [Pristis pectinata]|uniref:uncharacterized protein LOC127586634 n=1 Tax=Pristis pectinata TaxID=685728 RepID=UPI00223E3878|nr:uncharacterized protein LOC127586634 [Pristis pectinata]